jgi:hypothetical protein
VTVRFLRRIMASRQLARSKRMGPSLPFSITKDSAACNLCLPEEPSATVRTAKLTSLHSPAGR